MYSQVFSRIVLDWGNIIMVDIEPFKYQASTNIKEHNEIVDKVNEIVGVINDINLDGLDPRLTADEANIKKNSDDIAQLKISDTEHTAEINTLQSNVDNHAREITAIKAVDAKQSSDISALTSLTDALTKELPTEITLYRDGTGKIRAQVTQEDNTTFDSNTLDMIIPYQYDIISGTSARSFKLDITTSDGNHIVTNDFLIPEGGGTDITVTSITLQKDPANSNKVKVSIGLSDGTPLESGYVEMVNAVSGTFANNKLTITVNGVSSVPISIDATGTVYTEGTGIKITSGTISIDGAVVALKSDISDMETKTNANATFETKANATATYATKSALNTLQANVQDCFNDISFNDGSLSVTALDGQSNILALTTKLEWTNCSVNDLKTPSVWHIGDMIQGGTLQIGLESDNKAEWLQSVSLICSKVDTDSVTFYGYCIYNSIVPSNETYNVNNVIFYANGNIKIRKALPTTIPYDTIFAPSAETINLYKNTASTITGQNQIINVSSVNDAIDKAQIGNKFILPSIEYTADTAENTPMHVTIASGGPLVGSTSYLNTANMTVIAKTLTSITLNGYGRFAYKTSATSNTETTIQQMKISTDGSIEILVAYDWKATKTTGTITKINALICN